MTEPTSLFPTLTVAAWPDPVLDVLGFDARSGYVEQFWLPLIGPAATLLLRRFADGLEASPDGFTVPARDLARALGLGTGSGQLNSKIGRLRRFALAVQKFDAATGEPVLAVRTHVPALRSDQLAKLPASLQRAHVHGNVLEGAS